jgi:predicted phage terminase large subunit-like protein
MAKILNAKFNAGLVLASVKRGGLLEFVRWFWNNVESCDFIEEPHMVLICKHLEACALMGTSSLKPNLQGHKWADECPQMIKNLAIAVPPGMSKSKLVSVFFPAFVWTFCPGAKFITTSYADDLAIDFGRQSFDLMRSESFRACWPGLELEDGERAAMSDYRNTDGGRRWSLPMGGKVTGKHGHFLLSDDPTKPDDLKLGGDSAREALAQVKHRWDNLFSSRRAHAQTFTRIVIAQRLHTEDLTGHFVRQGAVHLRLPMLFEPHEAYESVWGDDWRTEPGELLAPLRFPQDVVDDTRKLMSARDFQAQQQQRPSPEDGSTFQRAWFQNRYVGQPWGAAHLTMSVDASNKKEGKARTKTDYTVITVWARVGPTAYLVDIVQARMGFNDQLIAVAAMRNKWPAIRNILVEDRANGSAIIDTLRKKFPGVIAVEPLGGKEARAASTEWVWAAGNVQLPASHPLVEDFVDEHILFPVGSTDDMVDSTSQFIAWSYSRDRKQLLHRAMENVKTRVFSYSNMR